MRGLIGGMMTGGLVSVVALGAVSVVSEQPAGILPPEAPLVVAPQVDPVVPETENTAVIVSEPSTPVGSMEIEEPQAPALPFGEADVEDAALPPQGEPDAQAPRADTDPLEEPEVMSIEGAMSAPDAPDSANMIAEPLEPVFPNPQSMPPQTPENEADLTISTTPAQPFVVAEPEDDVVAQDAPTAAPTDAQAGEQSGERGDDFFVVDLGAQSGALPDEDALVPPNAEDGAGEDGMTDAAPADQAEDLALNTTDETTRTGPRLQLQGGANALLGERETGVTVRRPGADAPAEDDVDVVVAPNALADFSTDAGDVGARPLMSIILIDDGTMSAAAAALAGLPFAVTIALDPALPNVGALMESYRADGFEVAVMAKLPEGALPSDVEVTFESVFATLPESIAVLDLGSSGLQIDRAVSEQAMNILAAQGRGFITVSQGLNMAGRAADQAGVPSVVVYRDLDVDDQDARVVRRFIDQAAFRARQESGVVLVGRVRPDTISALILWGTANRDDQVAVVPVSAVLLAQ